MSRMARRHAGWALLIVGATFLLPPTALAAKKVLRLRLDGPLQEAPDENAQLLALLMGGNESRTLYDTVQMIEQAAADDEIAGMALIIETPEMGLAQIEELSRALKGFRAAGKQIYCYMDYAANGSYALACAADHITLAQYSMLAIVGLHGEASFYKGLLDKIGVQADMMHCGAYKSALEPFTRTEPSPEAAENINWLLDGIYERWIEMMAEGRGLSAVQIEALVDRAPLDADESLEHKLIDAVGSFPEFKKLIYKEFGKDVEVVKHLGDESSFELDLENPFAIFQLFSEMVDRQREPAKPGIALIYIDGGIIVGKNDSGAFGGGMAGSTTIRAAFEQAYQDENVKAIVVRVDSPGGSALGSDIMWKAATRCASEKPLVVSMGNVAGSGGYYVSIPGDTIFAEASTITASIGVVGGKLVWSELMEDKLGITTTEFDRGQHAGLMSMNRPWSESEREWMMTYMNSVYEQFKGRIMSSRGDRIKGNLEDMAGGRVFTGRQALELGLVDRIGGLSDAIEYATEKAGLDEYEVYVLPEAKDFTDILAILLNEETEDEWEISLAPRASSAPLLRAALPMLEDLAPQRLRSIVQALRSLTTLSQERVGCFMPFDLTIR